MLGIYNTDGSIRVTRVDGSVLTGLYNSANQSLNVVYAPSPVTENVGVYHPCGAYYVTLTSSAEADVYAPDGSYYIQVTPFTISGALRVTFTDPHTGNDILLRDGASYILQRDGTSSIQLGY